MKEFVQGGLWGLFIGILGTGLGLSLAVLVERAMRACGA